MKKQNDSDEMPAEIDFRGGVRGKYAARYREGVAFAETRSDPIELYEFQSRMGRALLSAQAFERVLVAYFALEVELPFPNAAAETKKTLELQYSAQLERLLKEWSAAVTSQPPFAERMDHFLRERNWLVHQSWSGLIPDASTEYRHALSRRLESLTDEATFLGSRLDWVLSERLRAKGLSQTEIASQARKIRDLWAAA
jgi:hypothetical protein